MTATLQLPRLERGSGPTRLVLTVSHGCRFGVGFIFPGGCCCGVFCRWQDGQFRTYWASSTGASDGRLSSRSPDDQPWGCRDIPSGRRLEPAWGHTASMGRLARAQRSRSCPRSGGGVDHHGCRSLGTLLGSFLPLVASWCTRHTRGRLPTPTGLRGRFHPCLRKE
jgi:hypothetical protein